MSTITLRPATADDFNYCVKLYFAEMDRTLTSLGIDKAAHRTSFESHWRSEQVRLIQKDGADIGWLQTETNGDGLYLAQLFVEPSFQRQGIGTEVLEGLFREAGRDRSPVTLGVVKTNPALRLYERLGFRLTHDDARKFYMRREPAD